MNTKLIIAAVAASVLFGTVCTAAGPKTYSVASPDGSLAVTVSVGEELTWSLSLDGKTLLEPSQISMTLGDGTVYGASGGCRTTSVKEDDNNGLVLKFKSYDLIFKAFNEGIAYRFVSKAAGPFKVASEQATFALPQDWNVYAPYVRQDSNSYDSQFSSSFENHYSHFAASAWDPKRIAFLPVLVEAADGVKLCITETDLTDYPGMYLGNYDGSLTLTAVYPPYPKATRQGGYVNTEQIVTEREDFIAQYEGQSSFPWRIVAVSREDKDLLANTLTYRLATPAAEDADFSWVRPGKAAWDWWNAWNIDGVDFRSGINNDTYKYYIDFASQHGIEYVILDDGWSVTGQADLMQIVPEINLEELIAYADERNVGIILWSGYWAFDRDMENVCRHYSEMGVKGFKVDFMDRDDQFMVNFQRRAAETAAKYHLMLDFHGTFKPVGLHRAYPNVVNYEGVFGLEQMKFNKSADQVTYDVTIPFIRMVAGPLDYTQGAMRNATKDNYRVVYSEPMSQGTRCRQLAMYVVFDSPFSMLCDTPSAYMREPECLKFISEAPTVWDEVVPLAGEVGKYVAVAKRSGDTWYIGAMTDWDARSIELDLSFLGGGKWKGDLFFDGPNADRIARDYSRQDWNIDFDGTFKLTVPLAPGGGFAAVCRPE